MYNLNLCTNITKNIIKIYQLSSFNYFRPYSNVILKTNPQNLFKSFKDSKFCKLLKQNFVSKAAYDVNTNVAKDVVLFKYENPKFFNIINIFAFSQFLFWNYLSHFAFTTLRDVPVEKVADDAPWYAKINLGENKYRNALTVTSFLIGYGILAAAWLYTLRSVRLLILHKGGKTVSLVTYGPFNKNRIMSVPVNCLSAEAARESAGVQLPIKVKNRKLFYILDMRGQFTNPRLFDNTVGLKRRFV